MIAILLLVSGGLIAVLTCYRYWSMQAKRLQTSGHRAPDTSALAKLVFAGACKLIAFLTVGPVKVIGKENSPRQGRVLFVANHQVPVDFALLAAAAGRHYRALGDAAQFHGFLGVLACWVGIISVKFNTKADRAAGEAACVAFLSSKVSGLSLTQAILAATLFVLAALTALLAFSAPYAALALGLAACILLSLSGGDPALAIAPQGALLPDNVLRKEEFRAGAVRVARAAAAASGEPVLIVPVAIYYKRDLKDRHWTHRFLKRFRSLFPSMRNPRHFDPLFKLSTEGLDKDKRAELELAQARAIEAYKNSCAPIYGGVAVVGAAIDSSLLPEDPLEAIEVIRLKIVELLKVAESC